MAKKRKPKASALHLVTLLEHLAGERSRPDVEQLNCSWCLGECGRHVPDCELNAALERLRPGACAGCGCTEFDACVDPVPCHWYRVPTLAARGICSRCVDNAIVNPRPPRRRTTSGQVTR